MISFHFYYNKSIDRRGKRKARGRLFQVISEHVANKCFGDICYVTAAGRHNVDVILLMFRFNGLIKAVYSAEVDPEYFKDQVLNMNMMSHKYPSTYFSSFNGLLANIRIEKKHLNLDRVIFIDIWGTIDTSIETFRFLLARRIVWQGSLVFITSSLNPRITHLERYRHKHRQLVQIIRPELDQITYEALDLYVVDGLVMTAVQEASQFENKALEAYPVCKLRYNDSSPMGLFGYYVDRRDSGGIVNPIDAFELLS